VPDPKHKFAKIMLKQKHENSKVHSRTKDKLGETTTVNFDPSCSKIYSSKTSRQVHFSTFDVKDKDAMYNRETKCGKLIWPSSLTFWKIRTT
jgi:hypothetical protein